MKKTQDFRTHRFYIILDACRYDIFSEVINNFENLKGRLNKVVSYGYNTLDFYNNLPDLKDIVLITANPYPLKIKHKFKRVVLTPDINPKENIKFFLNIVKEQERKNRYLLHLIPPHTPWQGERGKIYYRRFRDTYKIQESPNSYFKRGFGPIGIESKLYKFYGKELSLDLYKENMMLALNAITEFKDNFSENFIITSDHGELFGEDNLFGHSNVFHEKLKEVPYYEVML